MLAFKVYDILLTANKQAKQLYIKFDPQNIFHITKDRGWFKSVFYF